MFLFSGKLVSQSRKTSIPEIRHFTKQNMGGQSQNWAIACDKNGHVYVGNNSGLFIYDGFKWQKHVIPNHTSIRSLQIDQDTLWIGAQDEIGFVLLNEWKKEFYSIKNQIPNQQRSFADVWDIYHNSGKTSFLSSNVLYEIGKDKHISSSNNPIVQLFSLYGKTYYHEINVGILELRNGKSKLVAGSDPFKYQGFYAMEYGQDESIYFGFNKQVYLKRNGFFNPIISDIDPVFSQSTITCGIHFKGGYAFGTQSSGIIITDENLKNAYVLNTLRGLQHNTVHHIAVDNHQNIWVALENGVDYIDLQSPSKLISIESNLSGYSINEHLGVNYWGTKTGVFTEGASSFNLVPGTEGQVWSLSKTQQDFFMSHQEGLFYFENDQFLKVPETYGSWKILQLTDQLVIEGNYFGLSLIKKGKNGWKNVFRTEDFNESSRFIEMDKSGLIWVAHPYKGLYSFDVDLEHERIHLKTKYGEKHGLNSNLLVHLFKLNDEVVISNSEGVFSYNQEQDSLVELEELVSILDTQFPLRAIKKDKQENIWFVSDNETGVLVFENGKYVKRGLPEINARLILGFENINLINDQVLFGVDEGFTLVNLKQEHVIPFNLTINAQYKNAQQTWIPLSSLEDNRLSYNRNTVRFHFNSNYQARSKHIKYRWKLIGVDSTWTNWSSEGSQQFINLNHGDYFFKLQGKLHGQINEIKLGFKISPPWFLSLLAKLVYALLGLLLLAVLLFLPNRKYKEEKKKLITENEASQDEIERLKSEKLQDEINFKNRQLASSTMHVLQKNETLNKLKEEIEKTKRQSKDPTVTKSLRSILGLLNDDIRLNEDWEKFAQYFDEVHSDFTTKLKTLYPNLTPRDIKLCAYLRMNLNTKEIAPLMNISVRGVEISRYRLRKKLELEKEVNLNDYMNSL